MLKSVEGVYRDGKIELTEVPGDVRNETRVIVTFLETGHIDLGARGIDEAQAAELRAQLGISLAKVHRVIDIYKGVDLPEIGPAYPS